MFIVGLISRVRLHVLPTRLASNLIIIILAQGTRRPGLMLFHENKRPSQISIVLESARSDGC
jgi:hypothetical protein